MNGSKKISDGYIRLDMPGGFPGDSINAFSPQGRTPLQNEAWNFMQKLLKWRKGEANEVIAKGTLKHFIPSEGVYVYERRLGDKAVVVMLNGSNSEVDLPMERFAEILPSGVEFTEILTESPVIVRENMKFAPKQIRILQNF